MNDYYVAHELLRYFVDEHEEEVAAGLPEITRKKNVMGLPLENFVKQDEEKIVLELSEIIIRKSLVFSL